MLLAGSVFVLGSVMLVNAGAGAQYVCPRAADPKVEEGWAAYRRGDITAARHAFEEAVGRCPGHVGGRVGQGYAALRQGRTGDAKRAFDAVLEVDGRVIDALAGRGIVAWRQGELELMERLFGRVLDLDPDHAEASRYLELVRSAERPASTPPATAERPPLEVPDSLEYVARAVGGRFEVRTDSGWVPFYVKGINLGAALPGRYASQFPDSAVYADWLDRMSGMGANAVRVYTRHPPHFYAALRAHNRSPARPPLWLIQGVWADLPPDGERYDDPAWQAGFFEDVRITVDILHGRADVAPRPGMAHGAYTADVSDWTLAIILGREWEATSVLGFNRRRPAFTGWDGRYASLRDGLPMEAWLTMAVDSTVGYETATYGSQRPVSFTSWPTTDPLHHPTEATSLEEARIRQWLGEDIRPSDVLLEGEDAVSIDPTRVETTAAFRAGFFATYHAYPYYPDFMNLSPEYQTARSPYGPSNYWGYLTDLKAYHQGLPVLIGEYGLPPSIGVSHVNPQGWHHGGLSEAAAAEGTARMTREIAAAGMAGGVVFAWIDEWFKRTWVTYQFESPRDRDRMWYNRLDSEEHYGLLAVEPAPRVAGETLEERLEDGWTRVPPLYDDSARGRLRVVADEAYLRVLYEPAGHTDSLLIGFDTVDPSRGDFRWPDGVGPATPVGLEVVLRLQDGVADVLQDTYSQPLKLESLGWIEAPLDPGPAIADPPRGFFRGRMVTVGRLRTSTRANRDGAYESPRIIFSRRVFGRDSTEYAAMGYNPGLLPRGPEPDGLWESHGNSYEFRIPWQLLNVGDPSQRRVLQDTVPFWRRQALATVSVPGIRVIAAARTAGRWITLPATGRPADVPLFSWPKWDEPQWRTRPRPLTATLAAAWTEIDGPVEPTTSP